MLSNLQILIYCLCGLLLTSCSGGGNDSSTTTPPVATVEQINGIVVPPEPDPVKNNATIAGIDSNNNGVRDDVERKIAAKTTDINYSQVISYAKSQELILNSELPKDRSGALAAIKKITCEFNKINAYPEQLHIEEILLNEPNRVKKMNDFNNISGGYFGSEVSCD